jgi:hypothetical protein
LRAVSSVIRKISKYAGRRTVGSLNWLSRVITKLRNAIRIPTGYQNATGFHLVSHLPKRNLTGGLFDEASDLSVDAGLHTDAPAILSIGFLDYE